MSGAAVVILCHFAGFFKTCESSRVDIMGDACTVSGIAELEKVKVRQATIRIAIFQGRVWILAQRLSIKIMQMVTRALPSALANVRIWQRGLRVDTLEFPQNLSNRQIQDGCNCFSPATRVCVQDGQLTWILSSTWPLQGECKSISPTTKVLSWSDMTVSSLVKGKTENRHTLTVDGRWRIANLEVEYPKRAVSETDFGWSSSIARIRPEYFCDFSFNAQHSTASVNIQRKVRKQPF